MWFVLRLWDAQGCIHPHTLVCGFLHSNLDIKEQAREILRLYESIGYKKINELEAYGKMSRQSERGIDCGFVQVETVHMVRWIYGLHPRDSSRRQSSNRGYDRRR